MENMIAVEFKKFNLLRSWELNLIEVISGYTHLFTVQ